MTEPEFYKSSFSNQKQNCVEVGVLPHGGGAIRDSKHPELGYLSFSFSEWEAFLTDIKAELLEP